MRRLPSNQDPEPIDLRLSLTLLLTVLFFLAQIGKPEIQHLIVKIVMDQKSDNSTIILLFIDNVQQNLLLFFQFSTIFLSFNAKKMQKLLILKVETNNINQSPDFGLNPFSLLDAKIRRSKIMQINQTKTQPMCHLKQIAVRLNGFDMFQMKMFIFFRVGNKINRLMEANISKSICHWSMSKCRSSSNENE